MPIYTDEDISSRKAFLFDYQGNPVRLDVSGALRALDPFHYHTHVGETFAFCHEFTLTDTTPQYAELVVGNRAMHMNYRDFFTNSTDMVLEFYYEPTITVGGAPVSITPRPFNWISPQVTTVSIQTVASFTGGTLACRNKIYGEAGVGGRSTGMAELSTLELNFPAFATIGIKVYRAAGVGTSKCVVRSSWYEAGSVIEGD